MKPPRPTTWSEWNQQQLQAALAEVRSILARAAGQDEATTSEPASVRESSDEFKFALDRVAEAFGLSPFERTLVLLCAGVELDSRFPPLLAQLNGDQRQASPSFALALTVLPNAHWSALSPSGPLRRWRLIETGKGDTFTSSPLRIDERVLHFLCGVETTDERLRGLVHACPIPGPLASSHEKISGQIAHLLGEKTPRTVIQLLGGTAAEQQAVAATTCGALGITLQVMRAADVPATAPEREAIARLCEREAALAGTALLLATHDADPGELARAAAFLNELGSIALVAGHEPLAGLERRTVRFEVPALPPAEQRTLWLEALGSEQAVALNGEIEAVAQQFRLDARSISEVAATNITAPTGRITLWQTCRLRTRSPLEALAQRIEARGTWADLVLPEESSHLLQQLAAHVRQRFRVYEDWGFAARQARGLGISALFSGPSGTGKTLAAEILASELQLDLFRIDLSSVVNKYIGETEKNLRRLFDAAEASGAILLFDEADALFGKRSETRSSHDRHANIEVGYLLQRMESYRGLAILTTNMKSSLDAAFLRRLRFVVNFPYPDAPRRAEIWRRAFPAATPTHGLDPIKLARLNVSGGHISNIALGAAVLAADAGESVRMSHLLQAARSECQKLERPPSETELGGWL